VFRGAGAARPPPPLRGTLARLPARARAQFLEGWRILNEEATIGVPADADDCSV